MEISKDTLEIIKFLEHIGVDLRKSNDFSVLLEIAATWNEADQITVLIFASASVWNLSKTLKKAVNQEGIANLERELQKSCSEMLNVMEKFMVYCTEDIKMRFERIYFAGNDGALRNLIDLAHDFAAFKDIQNKSRKLGKQSKKN